MFGLFRKLLKPSEFGAAVIKYSHELLTADAGGPLGIRDGRTHFNRSEFSDDDPVTSSAELVPFPLMRLS